MSTIPRIIITDDDASDRYLVKMAFEECGINAEVIEYKDGAELIEYLDGECKINPPCLVLLDLNMPKKTGLDVLQYVKNNPATCDASIIVFSTSSSPADIARAKELGAKDYIIKPNDYLGYVDIAKKLGVYVQTC